MSQLTLAMRARKQMGKPIPMVFRQLESLGAVIRRGQVAMLAGAPGRGKSAVASHISTYSGVPTLYFSADTDEKTLGVRVAAGLMKRGMPEIEELVKNDDGDMWSLIDEATSHVSWQFDKSPTLTDIEEEIMAYAVVNGRYPHLVVIDNLMDVAGDGSDEGERGSQDATIDFLGQLGRAYGCAILILLHVTGAYEDGLTPVPLSGLMNKVGKRPRLVLTLHQAADGILGVSVVKNSSGPADPTGQLMAHVGWNPGRSWFADGRE